MQTKDCGPSSQASSSTSRAAVSDRGAGLQSFKAAARWSEPSQCFCMYLQFHIMWPSTLRAQALQWTATRVFGSCWICPCKKKTTAWVQIRPLEKLAPRLDFGSFRKKIRIVSTSLPHPVGVFPMVPDLAKCHIRKKSGKPHTLIIRCTIP
jgi:hypothetical protein